jgi:hypothetical protein
MQPKSLIMYEIKLFTILKCQFINHIYRIDNKSIINQTGGYMENQNLPGTVHTDVTLGDWMITLLITFIPLVGFIMLFVWAFGGGTHPSKKTWAQATLIWFAIGIILTIIFSTIIISMIGSAFGGYSSYS